MRFASSREFRDWPAKAVTLFGMSGVGKTTLARMLQDYNWFHYSVDYRIGTRYMGEHIVDNFKREAMRVPFLRALLRSDSIYISSNLTFQNLEPLSTYLGKPGSRAKGGLPFAEYKRRQAQHREAEKSALLDVPGFIEPLSCFGILHRADTRPFCAEHTAIRAHGLEQQRQGFGGVEHRVVIEIAHAVGEALHAAADRARFKARVLIRNCAAAMRDHNFQLREILEHVGVQQ